MSAGTDVRWLLLKDLQILRRSPLLVALLVLYPIILAVLIGLALSAGPDKPKVAFVNLVPPGKTTFTIGGERLDAALNDADPGLAVPLVHLAVLTVAFTAVARLALRRFT